MAWCGVIGESVDLSGAWSVGRVVGWCMAQLVGIGELIFVL